MIASAFQKVHIIEILQEMLLIDFPMDLMRKMGFMKYSDGDGMLATSIAIFFGAFSSFLDWIWVNTVKLG